MYTYNFNWSNIYTKIIPKPYYTLPRWANTNAKIAIVDHILLHPGLTPNELLRKIYKNKKDFNKRKYSNMAIIKAMVRDHFRNGKIYPNNFHRIKEWI